MSIESLDFYFPFIVLFYGLLLSIVTSMPKLMKIGEEKIPPEFMQKLKAHRGLGFLCLIVGAFWSLQNSLL